MRRSILATALSGLVFPGIGQFSNRQFLKGAVLVLVVVLLFLFMYVKASTIFAEDMASLQGMSLEEISGWVSSISHRIPGSVRAAFWAIFGVWVFGIVDAYLVGKRLDREREAGSERGYNG